MTIAIDVTSLLAGGVIGAILMLVAILFFVIIHE